LKALVTGGTGFIGSHLVEALVQGGAWVRCLIRRTSDARWLRDLPVDYVYGDCRDKSSLKEAVHGVDQVFHLAGVTKAVKDETYFQVNAYGTENLVHACLEHNPDLQKFIYVSSQAAAGPSRNGCKKTETDHCEPVSSYGRSKRLGEELALAHVHELPLVILRPPVVYGPRETDLYIFLKLLAKRIQPFISGLDQRFTLCYVQDVVQAILLASEMDASRGEIFFLSDGTDYCVEEIGKTFAQAMDITPIHIRIPRWAIFGMARVSETLSKFSGKPPLINKGKVDEMVQRHWVCDISKAQTVLCFQPRVALTAGAKQTVDWYRREHWL
jgi:dihydroflavonol-4-reductase